MRHPSAGPNPFPSQKSLPRAHPRFSRAKFQKLEIKSSRTWLIKFHSRLLSPFGIETHRHIQTLEALKLCAGVSVCETRIMLLNRSEHKSGVNCLELWIHPAERHSSWCRCTTSQSKWNNTTLSCCYYGSASCQTVIWSRHNPRGLISCGGGSVVRHLSNRIIRRARRKSVDVNFLTRVTF